MNPPRSIRDAPAAALRTLAALLCALPVLCAAGAPAGAAGELLAHVLASADHGRAPIVVIDKRRARLWLFDADGRALGDAPVLLGWARGDHTVPGIGERPLHQVRPHERTTPAGRFVAERGLNADGQPVLWVDYDAAVSMHRAIAGEPGERRAQRLASATPRDNRISFGCINVPAGFFERTLLPVSQRRAPVVYVLPETRHWRSLFDVSAASRAVAPLR